LSFHTTKPTNNIFLTIFYYQIYLFNKKKKEREEEDKLLQLQELLIWF